MSTPTHVTVSVAAHAGCQVTCAPVVTLDLLRFDRLAAGQVPSDIAHPDDLAELATVLDVLDPRGRDFGTDVADLVAFCVDHRALRLERPVTAVSIHPTVLGEARDGGFLVLVTVADGCTLASDRMHTGDFDQRGVDAARLVLATVAATACAIYGDFHATAATVLSGLPDRAEGGGMPPGAP